jgi:hypothetical protein
MKVMMEASADHVEGSAIGDCRHYVAGGMCGWDRRTKSTPLTIFKQYKPTRSGGPPDRPHGRVQAFCRPQGG